MEKIIIIKCILMLEITYILENILSRFYCALEIGIGVKFEKNEFN